MAGVAVEIEPAFDDFVDPALLRLQYLHPNWEIACIDGQVIVANVEDHNTATVRQEVAFAIYRERIAREGSALRSLLLKTVLA